MSFLKELKVSFKAIRQNKGDYLFLFFELVIFSDMVKQMLSDQFLYINLLISFTLVLHKRGNLNKTSFRIIGVYLLLCFIPILLYGFDEYRSYVGYGMRLFTAALIANYFKEKFIVYFENIVFLLASISIPLFIVQLINPHFYDFLTPFSRLVMADERMWYLDDNGINMHQYCLFFVFNGWAQGRNSGFMWEPAAFGAVLTWAIIFNLFINRFRLNSKLIVLIISGLTTFSWGLYAYFMVILLAFVLQKGLNLRNTFALFFVFGGFILLVTKTSLLVDQYELLETKYELHSKIDRQKDQIDPMGRITNVNRIEGFFLNINKVLDSPFGYGMENVKLIFSSPNGFIDLLTKWGIGGLAIIIFCFYQNVKVLKFIYFQEINKITFLLIVLAFILPLSGNPFYNDIFVFTLMFIPFFIPKPVIIYKYGY